MKQFTLGVIFGNRDFFPDQLVTEARATLQALFTEMGIRGIRLGEQDSKLGAVETYADAASAPTCSRRIATRSTASWSVCPTSATRRAWPTRSSWPGCNVPVLVQAYPDDLDSFNVERRRDAFCGKISVCNNLRQYGFPFTLTDAAHQSTRSATSFQRRTCDASWASAAWSTACAAPAWAPSARGRTPSTPCATARKSCRPRHQRAARSTSPRSSARANRLSDDDPRVQASWRRSAPTPARRRAAARRLLRMAKLGVVLIRLDGSTTISTPRAIQCWTSMQKNYGVNVCTLMSMMSEKLMPSACEVDITGVASMYALQLASGQPSALVDWNNNYGDDPNKCVLFHCGNWAKSFFARHRDRQRRHPGHHAGRGEHLRRHRRARPRRRR